MNEQLDEVTDETEKWVTMMKPKRVVMAVGLRSRYGFLRQMKNMALEGEDTEGGGLKS